MKLKSIPFLLAFAAITSCSTSDIAVSENLRQNSSVMEVKGNAGILINQKVSFGKYYTSPIKRGWTERTELGVFGIKHQKAQQPIEFRQYSANNLSADIVGASSYNMNMFDLFKGLDQFINNYSNGFFGVIIPTGKIPVWKVFIQNSSATSGLKTDTDNGIAQDEAGNSIFIKGTKQLQEKQFLTDDTKTFGFELSKNGEAIAAVSVIGNGKVWRKNNLTAEDQLLVSSIASILIVRRNVSANQ